MLKWTSSLSQYSLYGSLKDSETPFWLLFLFVLVCLAFCYMFLYKTCSQITYYVRKIESYNVLVTS